MGRILQYYPDRWEVKAQFRVDRAAFCARLHVKLAFRTTKIDEANWYFDVVRVGRRPTIRTSNVHQRPRTYECVRITQAAVQQSSGRSVSAVLEARR